METKENEIKLSKNYTLKSVQYHLDKYKDDNDEDSKTKLIGFIYERFKTRFFIPLSKLNGNHFMQTAICCLLIESIYCFEEGKKDNTKRGESTKAFVNFLKRLYPDSKNELDCKNEPDSKNEEKFYKSIRCGILHQSETTNGWRIKGDSSSKGIDFDNKIVYANKLVRELEDYFDNYIEKLKTEHWSFKLAIDKIKCIVVNSKK